VRFVYRHFMTKTVTFFITKYGTSRHIIVGPNQAKFYNAVKLYKVEKKLSR
jgi:hypothetical protein